MGVLAAQSFAMARIAKENQGILGGPSSAEAPQIATEQATVGIGVGNNLPSPPPAEFPEPISESELSTASLDGAKILEKQASGKVLGSPSTASDERSPAGEHEAAKPNAPKATMDSVATPKPKAPAKPKTEPKPKSSRYFVQPARGLNWGVLHNKNGVDIANSCGTPVVAAAAGTVVADPGLGNGRSGWGGGYGKFVLIKHANGTKTRYAHLSKIDVNVGETVEQGQQIGKIGNTGQVVGATGCHLHFEVLGGVNPFAK